VGYTVVFEEGLFIFMFVSDIANGDYVRDYVRVYVCYVG
jgi:hypothetical protein